MLSLAAAGCAEASFAAESGGGGRSGSGASGQPRVPAESGERVECGAEPGELACCPVEWKAGSRCNPKSESCWTECLASVPVQDGGIGPNRAQLTCGSEGIVISGHGLFPCQPKPKCRRNPKWHRKATVCDDFRPPGVVATAEHYKPLCQSDADCTEGRNGRCTPYGSYWGTNGMTSLRCTYDACTSDGDCAANELCHCGEESDANECVRVPPKGCRVDTDCVETGYCSPSIRWMVGERQIEYACRTCEDECSTDFRCNADPTMSERSCLWIESKKHWACDNARTGME